MPDALWPQLDEPCRRAPAFAVALKPPAPSPCPAPHRSSGSDDAAPRATSVAALDTHSNRS
eukprot:9153928-Pyramimonas_sp.AAC.1